LKYLLDTNICIFLIKQQSQEIVQKLSTIAVENIFLSAITVAELRFGADKSQFSEKNHSALDEFFLPFTILPFNENAALAYGKIRSQLEKKGLPIGSMDMLIASIAYTEKLTVVTSNTSEFKRVPGLKVENWVKK
jgi:tRNA(fMet)-specific endonuclease VapC